MNNFKPGYFYFLILFSTFAGIERITEYENF